MTEANRNLLIRVATAVVLIPPLLAAIFWHRHEALAALIHLAVAVAFAEFLGMTLADQPWWSRTAGILLGVLVSVVLFWWPASLPTLLLGIILLLPTLHLVSHRSPRDAVMASAMTLFGICYIAILLTTTGLLKRLPNGTDWVILALSVTWFADTGAYFVGRFLGRHPLYPSISPKKTVEGALGALVSALLATVIARLWYMPQLTWIDAAMIALQAGALGQVGDLVESMLKRAYAVKDSGSVIPGHGGLLDRIDGLLFVGPYIYLYAKHVVLG